MAMMKWLSRLLWIPVLLVAVMFLVANRQETRLSLDPFNASAPAVTSFPLPLWGWLVLMLFLGFGLGAVALWISARPKRARARAEHRELKSLRKALTEERRRREEAERALQEASHVERPPPQDAPLLETHPS